MTEGLFYDDLPEPPGMTGTAEAETAALRAFTQETPEPPRARQAFYTALHDAEQRTAAAGEPPPHTASTERWRGWHLSQVAAIARDPAVTDAQAGARVRALLYPSCIPHEGGTAEGCPGCFPPGDTLTGDIMTAAGPEAGFSEYREFLAGNAERIRERARAIIRDAAIELDWLLHAVETVDRWLDSDVAPAYRDQPLAQDWARVAKAGEEDHEAVAALIAMTGQNPRKGTCGTREELLAELADAAVTRLFAIQHFTKDIAHTWCVLTEAMAKAYGRAPEQYR